MNLKQAVVFAILMENNDGVRTKSPEYVREKLEACEKWPNPEMLLDNPNLANLKTWKTLWQIDMEIKG